MSICVPTLLKGSRAGRKDMVGGFLSTTERTLVTADFAPQPQVGSCGECVDARVEDELHGSLRQSIQEGFPGGVQFHLLENLDELSLGGELPYMLCLLPFAVFLGKVFYFLLDGSKLGLGG